MEDKLRILGIKSRRGQTMKADAYMWEFLIKPELVSKLRSETGRGIGDCQRALRHNEWDYDKAKDYIIKNPNEFKI